MKPPTPLTQALFPAPSKIDWSRKDPFDSVDQWIANRASARFVEVLLQMDVENTWEFSNELRDVLLPLFEKFMGFTPARRVPLEPYLHSMARSPEYRGTLAAICIILDHGIYHRR